MRIIYFTYGFEIGGAEKQFFFKINALNESNNSLLIISWNKGGIYEEKIQKLNCKIIYLPDNLTVLNKLKISRTIVKEYAPDIIESTHFHLNLYVGIVGRITRIPSIGALRSDVFSEIKRTGKIKGLLAFWIPNYLVANSLNARKNALSFGKKSKNVFYVPNAVEIPKIYANNETNLINLLFVGRLIKLKNVDFILEAFNILSKYNSCDLKLKIVGGGPELNRLKSIANEFDLKKVKFLGAQKNTNTFYRQADIFVFASSYEGMPNVILEAISHGIPVVSSNIGGVKELINHGNTGFLYEPCDLDSFVHFINLLISNKTLRNKFTNNALKKAKKDFSEENLKTRLNSLYEAVLVKDRKSRNAF